MNAVFLVASAAAVVSIRWEVSRLGEGDGVDGLRGFLGFGIVLHMAGAGAAGGLGSGGTRLLFLPEFGGEVGGHGGFLVVGGTVLGVEGALALVEFAGPAWVEIVNSHHVQAQRGEAATKFEAGCKLEV